MSSQLLTYIFVGLSFALYIGIAIWSRANSTNEFYVAGKGVNPVANGMALSLIHISEPTRPVVISISKKVWPIYSARFYWYKILFKNSTAGRCFMSDFYFIYLRCLDMITCCGKLNNTMRSNKS